MSKTLKLGAIAITMLFAVNAAAQANAASKAKADASKEQKIRTLLDLVGVSKLGVQVMDAMLDQFEQLPDLPKGFITEFKKLAKPEQLVDMIVPIYSRHFEEADIDGLIEFYKSPVGQKFIKAQPQMTKESMEAGQQWGEILARQVLQKLETTR